MTVITRVEDLTPSLEATVSTPTPSNYTGSGGGAVSFYYLADVPVATAVLGLILKKDRVQYVKNNGGNVDLKRLTAYHAALVIASFGTSAFHSEAICI